MRITQKKGDAAVARAISTFTGLGFDVSIPLTESASYDIVVDTGPKLVKVQVRYTSCDEVDLRRIHSNSLGYVVKKTKQGAYDWLFVLKNDGKEYLITEPPFGRRSLKPKGGSLIESVVNRDGWLSGLRQQS